MEYVDIPNSPHLATVIEPNGLPGRQATVWHGGEDGHEDEFIAYCLSDDEYDPRVIVTAYFDTAAEAAEYALAYVSGEMTIAA
jgi:hypothetical protein